MNWEIGQLLLYIMALGVPTVWFTQWLYRMWHKANAPAIIQMISRQRRRDAMIKQTRERTTVLEGLQENVQQQIEETAKQIQDFEVRIQKLETMIARLRHRLRQRGIVTDA